jgi:hypothetical protein
MTRDVFNGSGGTQVRFIIGLDLSKQDDRSPCTWEHGLKHPLILEAGKYAFSFITPK